MLVWQQTECTERVRAAEGDVFDSGELAAGVEDAVDRGEREDGVFRMRLGPGEAAAGARPLRAGGLRDRAVSVFFW